MKQSLQSLIMQLQKPLPGIESHKSFYPYRFKDENSIDFSTFRKAVVGIHVFQSEDGLSILLIERSEYDGTHSKQIAFPGGKVDATDHSSEFTARRESFEEVAIPLDAGEVIGQLTEVNIPVSKFNVIPFVFYHENLPELKKNEREVNEILTIRFSDLLNDQFKTITSIRINKQVIMPNVPCFIINEKIIWGATALILNELKLICKEAWGY